MFPSNIEWFTSTPRPLTLEEKDIQVGDNVWVKDSDVCAVFGTILELNPAWPFVAKVKRLIYGREDEIKWIHAENLNHILSGGVLHSGHKTIQERGLKIGDIVNVGGSYSKKLGKIIALSPEFPTKAYIELMEDEKTTTGTHCWIKSMHLSKRLQIKAVKLSLTDAMSRLEITTNKTRMEFGKKDWKSC